MNQTEYFYLVARGEGRWIIKHQVTHESAGKIVHTTRGFTLSDEESRLIGSFDSIDDALRGLYALV
jgi:hypothetical protein